MAFIEEIPSDCSDIGAFLEHASSGNTSHSNADAEEVEKIISDVGRTTNTELVRASATGSALRSVAAQDNSSGRSAARFGVNTDEEYESISEAPIRRVERDRRPSSPSTVRSNTSSMIAEPSGSLAIDTSHYRAALLIVAFREPRALGDPIPEPPPLPAYLAHNHAGPSQARLEPEQSPNLQASRPKKRRRKGLRFTHVKNSRAKRATAATHREEDTRLEAAAGLLAIGRGGTTAVPMAIGQPVPHLMHAAGRDSENAEPMHPIERETRRDKGKGKAKELPDSEAATTGSKRSREEKNDDVCDTQPVPSQPGPSRPTRRTRRRLEQSRQLDQALATPVTPDLANVRQLRSRLVPLPEIPVARRGQKRRRSLVPEPSEQLVDEVRKRPRIITPAPEYSMTR